MPPFFGRTFSVIDFQVPEVEGLAMRVGIDGVPSWKFEIEEVSAGAYRLRGTHSSAATIDLTGADPDSLVEAGKQRALSIERDLAELRNA
jgi:hypothetical protein